MKSELPVIRRGSFAQGFISASILIFIVHLIFGESSLNFSLSFIGFEEQIVEVTIKHRASVSTYKLPQSNASVIDDTKLEIMIPDSEGVFDITILTATEALYELKNVEYKSGEYNYIAKRNEKLSFVKGHWQ